MSRHARASLLLVFAVSAAGVVAEQAPISSPGGPDAAAYGQAESYPIGTASTVGEQRYLVGGFSHFDQLFPQHAMAAAPAPWPFQRAPDRLIRYRRGADARTLDDYLSMLPVTGLLIAKDDAILAERYQYGRTDRDHLTSQSMAKTIVGLLIGLAIADRKIADVGDQAGRYVTALGASPYGQTPIRDLLHMSSGVSCPPAVDGAALTTRGALGAGALATCVRVAPAGTAFSYSNLDSEVLGLVARQAFGQPLATVLHDRIWAPMGAESAASWTIDADGQEAGFCCINATLRDYARLGRLLANDGVRDGRSLVPRQWLIDGTTVVSERDPQLTPGKSVPFFGYGYHVWILPDERRMFCLIGANGQRLFVDPAAKLVMVQTAVEKEDVNRDLDSETIALWLSLIAQFGRLG